MEEIIIPGGGMAMEEATLAEWAKQPGDPVVAGDVVAIVETDKALVEVEAETDGVMGPHLHSEGSVLPVATTIGHVLPVEVVAQDE